MLIHIRRIGMTSDAMSSSYGSGLPHLGRYNKHLRNEYFDTLSSVFKKIEPKKPLCALVFIEEYISRKVEVGEKRNYDQKG